MNAATEREVASFESHRRALTGLAYRMLGSRAEAEDVVQDAYFAGTKPITMRSKSRAAISARS